MVLDREHDEPVRVLREKGLREELAVGLLTLNSVGCGFTPNSAAARRAFSISAPFGDSSGTFVKMLGDMRPEAGGWMTETGMVERRRVCGDRSAAKRTVSDRGTAESRRIERGEQRGGMGGSRIVAGAQHTLARRRRRPGVGASVVTWCELSMG